ncbi:Phosphoserine phosphatase [Macaca fascicularis]|uniref:Phosphoserine phosphatase n=1 Tax=Macaca fascicularis TaxID=9541 RepID=G7P1Q8_MACFA|nr:Phosphoserine phosphatase [Macaca fascicularis]
MVSHSELRKLFYSADAVCFDVDSTVIREEGISELAKICGVEDAVSEMDAFIGFGGNVIRQQVKDNAKWYITDFVELVGELEE